MARELQLSLVTKNTFLEVVGSDPAESPLHLPQKSSSAPVVTFGVEELPSRTPSPDRTWSRIVVKRTFITVEDEDDFRFEVKRAQTECALKRLYDDDDASSTAASSDDQGSSSETQEIDFVPGREPGDVRTTVMLKHLPNNYTREMFLDMLDREGFAGQYDFVYLPIDFRRHAALGYAFVNLVDPDTVPRFWKVFEGFKNWVLPTAKVCEMGWSDPLQGLEANVERYRNSPVMHKSVPKEYRPLLFVEGQQVEFPKPTRSLRPPYKHY